MEARRPAWYQLWLLLPLLGIAAFLEAHARLSTFDHKVAEVGLVVLAFGLVFMWLRENRAALLRESSGQAGQAFTYRLISAATQDQSGPNEVNRETRPISVQLRCIDREGPEAA